ncbi:LPO_1073/Vpar_1526 family protein [Clostridium formicaceticum]|uniref:Uncharacterized protein n=1 Tax=Clostridium formicaceticum TaxID=1497 RepID=A0AAC9WFW5_9CLOT|nr:LPO_1073/Vpar_1526 family protein [Clostridium formicaceticum]AOY76701.1 hypothetical protein BJL90_12985 [Clostridium formicaceticum]ARE87134.1 hypothetical protein CLFO_15200 [Clostridium formicaceticum]
MNDRQKQSLGNNSSAIQVSGDMIVGSSYKDIKEIFMDLFEMNFPRIQDVARQEADIRVSKGLDSLEDALSRHHDSIDTERFIDPNIQYELQGLGKSFARFGDKCNYELLSELFATLLNKDATDVVSLIAGEALQVVPKLTKRHVSVLTLMCLVYDLTMDDSTLSRVNSIIDPIVKRINSVDMTRLLDLSYLTTMNCMRGRAITISNNQPLIITNTDEYKAVGSKNFRETNAVAPYKNLSLIVDWMNLCQAGRYELTPLGRLIGMTYINDLVGLNVNDFII